MFKILIFSIQSWQSVCNCQTFLWIRFQLLQLNFAILKFLHELNLTLRKKQQPISFTLVSSSSSNSMNIRLDIFRTVKLNDPINLREIHTSWSNICAEKIGKFLLNKVKIDCSSLILFLSSMKFHQMYFGVQFLKSFVHESNFFTRLKEDNAFRLSMTLDKTEQGVHLLFNRQLHVVMI